MRMFPFCDIVKMTYLFLRIHNDAILIDSITLSTDIIDDDRDLRNFINDLLVSLLELRYGTKQMPGLIGVNKYVVYLVSEKWELTYPFEYCPSFKLIKGRATEPRRGQCSSNALHLQSRGNIDSNSKTRCTKTARLPADTTSFNTCE